MSTFGFPSDCSRSSDYAGTLRRCASRGPMRDFGASRSFTDSAAIARIAFSNTRTQGESPLCVPKS